MPEPELRGLVIESPSSYPPELRGLVLEFPGAGPIVANAYYVVMSGGAVVSGNSVVTRGMTGARGWWGQLQLAENKFACDANAVIGALNVDVVNAAAGALATNFRSGADVYACALQKWTCAGVPDAAWGSDGDEVHRSDGGVGSSIYKKLAGVWTAIV